jgi:4-alpha-glucanotransferase
MAPWIERSAGVLLHPTSLPHGRLDAHAARFADFAAACGFRVWQMLPVGTVDNHDSPYTPASAVAGNAALFAGAPPPERAEVEAFVEANADWLPDYALFTALEARFGGTPWYEWPAPLRARDPSALAQARAELAEPLAAVARAQCAFEAGWARFRAEMNGRGLLLFGDVPLFLAHHSADVWAHPELFELDAAGRCEAVMGVPPDAFSDDGQWWGYPPYRWDAMAAEGFRWWKRRFGIQARRFDLVRIDHFRGLAAFWRIPRGARKAAEGAWTPGPGRACLDALVPVLGGARFVAEDLGMITDDVVEMRKALGIPGMRVLQFAFDGDPRNPHLPANHEPDSVCYTGTHDNDTTLGWWDALDEPARAAVRAGLGDAAPAMPQALVECAWAAPAPLAIVPMQDLLGLGSEARMNTPGEVLGNWGWRFDWEDVPPDLAGRVRAGLVRNGRAR